jgi:uncharacterized protein (DUF2384 family)
MTDRPSYEAVEQCAHMMFGKYARQWLFKPNRTFAQLSPYEFAQSPDGARLVLAELKRTVLVEDGVPPA